MTAEGYDETRADGALKKLPGSDRLTGLLRSTNTSVESIKLLHMWLADIPV